ncbi:MAG: LacI family DNA-binding transcriptional regulator [Synergistaceae bacterium]|nr:LacI family DNA-binding transcriptional regulator [Synergistaceae bacterium]
MKVTMQDVAGHAGVDKATVSRVLRGDHRISEKTKVRVMESVRALGYRLDRNARSLSTRSSGLIGVVVRELNVPWMGAFLAGIERALSNSEYDFVLKSTEGNPLRARRELSTLDERGAEGLIWCDADNFPRGAGLPVVCFGFSEPEGYSVKMEDESEPPSFETGVLAGRLALRLVSGKPVPGREIMVKAAEKETE